jgi:hypothetical protein
MICPSLPNKLTTMGARLVLHAPEEETPFPWAVWDADEEGGDILGCGFTAEEAIRDACDQVTKWEVSDALQAGQGAL